MKEMLRVVSGFGFWVVWPWMPTSFYLSLCSLRQERDSVNQEATLKKYLRLFLCFRNCDQRKPMDKGSGPVNSNSNLG